MTVPELLELILGDASGSALVATGGPADVTLRIGERARGLRMPGGSPVVISEDVAEPWEIEITGAEVQWGAQVAGRGPSWLAPGEGPQG